MIPLPSELSCFLNGQMLRYPGPWDKKRVPDDENIVNKMRLRTVSVRRLFFRSLNVTRLSVIILMCKKRQKIMAFQN